MKKYLVLGGDNPSTAENLLLKRFPGLVPVGHTNVLPSGTFYCTIGNGFKEVSGQNVKEERRVQIQVDTKNASRMFRLVASLENGAALAMSDILAFEANAESWPIKNYLGKTFTGRVVLDLETSGFFPFEEGAQIRCVALADPATKECFTLSFAEFKELLTNGDWNPIEVVGHNIKFDLKWLVAFGIEDALKWRVRDTAIRENIINENSALGLDELSLKYTKCLNYWSNFDYDMLAKGKVLSPSQESAMRFYAAKDVEQTAKVFEAQEGRYSPKVEAFELSKLRTLLITEMNGMEINEALLKAKMRDARKRIKALGKKMLKYAASVGIPELNINSPKQIGQYLYEIKKYPPNKTEKGNWATGSAVMEALLLKHPDDVLLQHLDEYRGLEKLVGTYYENIQSELGRNACNTIYPNFNQTSTTTFRLSSSGGINYQNIPARDSEAVETLFTSSWGERGLIVKADYSQMELRLLADISRDRKMIDAFKAGRDFHDETAAVLGIDRAKAKTFNFRVAYGGGSRDETERFFEHYEGARKWSEKVKADYAKSGISSSLFGHRRHLPIPTKSDAWGDRMHWERQAVNFPIQSAAAQMVLIGMKNLLDLKARASYSFKIVNTIHDAVLLDVPRNEFTNDFLIQLEDCLVNQVVDEVFRLFGYQILVPLKVDVAAGPSWGEVKSVEIPKLCERREG